ncbi:PTS sugar transporter subunit IIC [Vagococcus lutrae]|uniref:PTS sugar transporter subunit IIC n=1 Tax=Vagococcus lutrae TaxID=81947 RepID=UPI0023A94C7E|nr:PTS transporter subunit EIIC [Vagococcus lutrae]WEB81292.1 PTS transporter subunit EIIC [Vagococcus lutrae]
MNKMESFFNEKLQPVFTKLSNHIILKSVMNALMMLLPVTIVGSFSILLGNFAFLGKFGKQLSMIGTYTNSLMGVFISFSIAYSYLKIKGNKQAVVGGLLSLVSFLILTPLQEFPGEKDAIVKTIVVDTLSFYGAMGMFTAIIFGLLVGFIYNTVIEKNWTIKMPDSVPENIAAGFSGLIPGAIILLFASIVAFFFSLTPFESVHTVIYALLQRPLTSIGGTFGGMIIVALLSQVLWFFGIHGSMVVLSVMLPIWMPLGMENLAAFQAGRELPNIISSAFFTTYTPGGFGISTALVLLLAKSQRYKTLGKLSTIPALFNITEPIIFGMPLVLNPIFMIPFIFSNAIGLSIAYFCTLTGIVPPPIGIDTPSGTPIIMGAFLQGSWKIAVLQVVLIIIIALFWYPFVKIADKMELQAEKEHIG